MAILLPPSPAPVPDSKSRGNQKTSVRDLLARLSNQGARAAAWPCDVGDANQLLHCLERCKVEGWPAIRGVVQGAMVLQDSVQGTYNLHRYLPQDLDFFVVFSSIAGIGGSRGQGNYAAGNTYQDALAHHRRGLVQKACTIDVGMILRVGFQASESTDNLFYENMNSWIMTGIREKEFLGILQAAIQGQSVIGSEVPPQVSTGGMWTHAGKEDSYHSRDAKLAHLVRIDTHQLVQNNQEDSIQLQVQLARASNVEPGYRVCCGSYGKEACQIYDGPR
ncbi:hypothetical protein SCAR479_00586 [Seiridium cardinale]|uniref:Ketoreductase domain-containing protein n=1 Tax=Seiridium cardinale TaxID=138064 RepID=A0ABR2YAH2_9PEZI